jgi:hypothetical protein
MMVKDKKVRSKCDKTKPVLNLKEKGAAKKLSIKKKESNPAILFK